MKANAKNSVPLQPDSRAGRAPFKLPPLKALRAFEAASSHGSFAQGAEELGVTASAVSHHIQSLEDFLGVRLFHRQSGRVALTSAGLAYAKEIELAFGIIANATNTLTLRPLRDRLVIASAPGFAAKWLQPRLPHFLETCPDLKVRLSTLSDHASLDENRFDVAITYGRPALGELNMEPLLVEHLRPLCSPGLASALGLKTPYDLSRATLIHSKNTVTWSEYFRVIGIGELRPYNELWLDRSTMAIDAAANGMGVVLESEVLAERELRDGRLVAPLGETDSSIESTSYFLIVPKGHRGRAPGANFITWLRSEIPLDNRVLSET